MRRLSDGARVAPSNGKAVGASPSRSLRELSIQELAWRYLLLLPLVGLAACAGKIEGTVFLDSNSNGIADPKEKTLTNVAVKVVHDDEVLARARTNKRGFFSVKTQETGYYCIEVDEPGLNQNLMRQLASGEMPASAVPSFNANVGFGPPAAPSAKKQIVGPSPVPPPTPPAPVPPTPPGTPPKTEEETKKTEEDKKEEKKGGEKETGPDQKPARPEKKSSGLICSNFDDPTVHVDVAVTLDYSADLARMPVPLKKTRKSGENFRVSIPLPFGCVLRPLFVPDGLEVFWPQEKNLRDPSILTIDPNVGRVDFREDLLAASATLDLRVKGDLPLGTHTVTIQPEALCPDGEEFALNPIEMDLKATPEIVVWQKIPDRGRSGGSVTWEVVVENKGTRDLVVTVLASPPMDLVSIGPFEGLKCHAAGDKIECPSLELPAESDTSSSPLKFQVNFLNFNEEKSAGFQVSVKIHDYEGDPIQATDARVVIEPGN